MKIRYIGLFPPPYGGVTIKNKLIYDCLSETKKIVKFNRPRWMPREVFQILNLMTGIIPNQSLIIGVSAAGGKSKLVTKTLYFFARRNMNRSLYFMMGGQECYRIADNKEEIKWYSEYKKIYVETETMKKIMVEAGINNVEIFPNCRRKPKSEMRAQGERQKLRCVFFSNIKPEKGADIILEVAKGLHNIEFFFYGPIESEFDEVFKRTVSELENVHYMGIFKGSDEEKYKELRKYDVLLLPTRWKNEGVPGILVEGKIAGLAEVVSNESYNSEIVKDGVEGIVLKENTKECLVETILHLESNRGNLRKMQVCSKESAKRFFIETYLPSILCQLD